MLLLTLIFIYAISIGIYAGEHLAIRYSQRHPAEVNLVADTSNDAQQPDAQSQGFQPPAQDVDLAQSVG